MKCKKELMGLSALLILFFHLYIPFTTSALELSLQRSAYIGVDLFFFLSAYSLGRKTKINWRAFFQNRFCVIYLPFVLFAVFTFFYQGWKFKRLLEVVSGVEFLRRGGGSFLWFFPGMFLFYFMTPLWLRVKEAFSKSGLLVMLMGWLLLAVFVQFVLKQNQLLLLIHRMPIFFLGLYYEEGKALIPEKWKIPVLIGLLVVGSFLMYRYGAIVKLNKPLRDFYYIVAIPFELAVVGFCDRISGGKEAARENASFAETQGKGLLSKALRLVGTITLELYALQMIVGYNLEGALLTWIKNGQVSFVLTCAILMALSYGLCRIKNFTMIWISERKKNL